MPKAGGDFLSLSFIGLVAQQPQQILGLLISARRVLALDALMFLTHDLLGTYVMCHIVSIAAEEPEGFVCCVTAKAGVVS